MAKLNFRELEVLQTLLAEGTVSLASRKLNVTQPAVSMMLRQAEARLGFPLFDRIGNRLVPTEQLREIAPLLGSLFTQMDDLSTQVARVRSGQLGILRIGATAALSGAFVDDALYLFQSRAPQVTVSLHAVPNSSVISGIEQGRFDIGIAYSRTTAPDTSFRIIGSTEAVCLMLAGHALAGEKEVRPEHLADQRLLSYRPDTVFGRKLRGAFEACDHRFAPAIEASAFSAASLAAKGAGIALVDRLVANMAEARGLISRPFSPQVTNDLYLLRSATGSTQVANLFEQTVIDHLET